MKKNKKIAVIAQTLKRDWILLLIFILISFSVSGQVYSLISASKDSSEKLYFFEKFVATANGSYQHTMGANNIIYWLFSGPAIAVMLIYFIIMFNIHFLMGKSSRKIGIWLTTSISRRELFFTKVLSIYIEMAIIYLPVLVLSFYLNFYENTPNGKLFLFYFLQLLEFSLFTFTITMIFALMYLYLIDKMKTVNFISFAIVVILIVLFVFHMLNQYSLGPNKTSILGYFDLFNAMSNMYNSHFDHILKLSPNYIKLAVYLCLCVGVSSGVVWLNLRKFINMDFNI